MSYFASFFLLTLLSFSSAALSQESVLTEEPPEVLKRILKKYDINRDQIGYSLIPLDDEEKKEISFNGSKYFIPGSVGKVPSMVFSLKTLGSDFRFATSLYYTGEIEGRDLKGDIYIKGTGDPFLTASDLHELSIGLYGKKITGNFYYDESFFETKNRISSIGLEDQADNPSLTPLSSEFNRIHLYKNDNSFIFVPPLKMFRLKSSRDLFPGGLKFRYLTENENKEEWEFNTKDRYSNHEELPVYQGGLYTASLFRYLASLHKVKLSKPVPGTTPDNATKLFTHRSMPLVNLVESTFEYSNNVFAELIFKRAMRRKFGKISYEDEVKKYNAWLRKTYPNVPWKDSYFANASGLTSKTKVSPEAMARFMAKLSYTPIAHHHIWSLLPISGKKGTLYYRFRDKGLPFKIWAKTGTLHFASGLAGYLISKSGKRYAFSLFFNDQKSRRLLDSPEGKGPLGKKLRQKAKLWLRRVLAAQEDFLTHVIKHQ